jgi:hypothetical protein
MTRRQRCPLVPAQPRMSGPDSCTSNWAPHTCVLGACRQSRFLPTGCNSIGKGATEGLRDVRRSADAAAASAALDGLQAAQVMGTDNGA